MTDLSTPFGDSAQTFVHVVAFDGGFLVEARHGHIVVGNLDEARFFTTPRRAIRHLERQGVSLGVLKTAVVERVAAAEQSAAPTDPPKRTYRRKTSTASPEPSNSDQGEGK